MKGKRPAPTTEPAFDLSTQRRPQVPTKQSTKQELQPMNKARNEKEAHHRVLGQPSCRIKWTTRSDKMRNIKTNGEAK
jgi:hypothetical protein